MEIDYSKCMSRRNMKNKINEQCINNPKHGEYCGIHYNNPHRIDEPLEKSKSKSNSKSNDKQFLHYKKRLVLKKNKYSNEIPEINKGIKLITFNSFQDGQYRNATILDLKFSLHYLKLPSNGDKNILLKRIEDYYKPLSLYHKSIDKIIFLQKQIKSYCYRKLLFTRGAGYFDINICTNEFDIYTYDNKNDIKKSHLISYSDDKFVYWFDVRTIRKLEEKDPHNTINPFNNSPFPTRVLINANNICNELEKKKLLEYEIEIELTADQKISNYTSQIFQKINELDNYTHPSWFNKLSLGYLKNFYCYLYAYWYDANNLTEDARKQIVPNQEPFTVKPNQIKILKSMRKVKQIILESIDKIISSAHNKNDKVTGAMYVIKAFCEVSVECRQSYSWMLF